MRADDRAGIFVGVCAAVLILALLVAVSEDGGWTVSFARGALVLICIRIWFLTQRALDERGFPEGGIVDMVHLWTDGINRLLRKKPGISRALLICSSAGIDLFGIFLVSIGVFGNSVAPFAALVLLFTMRQLSQWICALPAPEGMIWKDPGFPSVLVTYETRNDFFFSGHTAIAVLGALFAGSEAPAAVAVAAWILAAGEVLTVLVLRAHYTMDVICAVLAAVASYFLAVWACGFLGI